MHKIRQKQPADAEAIWWEGVAKHPDRSGQIFDDLAILFRDRANYVNAVACARAMTLMLSSGARLPTAQTIWQTSLAKTTDPVQLAQINDYVEGMPAEIDRPSNIATWPWNRSARASSLPPSPPSRRRTWIFLDGEITTGAKLVSTPQIRCSADRPGRQCGPVATGHGFGLVEDGNILLSPAKTPAACQRMYDS